MLFSVLAHFLKIMILSRLLWAEQHGMDPNADDKGRADAVQWFIRKQYLIYIGKDREAVLNNKQMAMEGPGEPGKWLKRIDRETGCNRYASSLLTIFQTMPWFPAFHTGIWFCSSLKIHNENRLTQMLVTLYSYGSFKQGLFVIIEFDTNWKVGCE